MDDFLGFFEFVGEPILYLLLRCCRVSVAAGENLNIASKNSLLPTQEMGGMQSVVLDDLAGRELVFPDARAGSRLSVWQCSSSSLPTRT